MNFYIFDVHKNALSEILLTICCKYFWIVQKKGTTLQNSLRIKKYNEILNIKFSIPLKSSKATFYNHTIHFP